MCDVQPKLIAWLDRELSAEKAAGVERHIERCEECRSRQAAYEQVDETFDAYCDAVMAAKLRPRIPRWVPVLASAMVAAGALFLIFPRTRVEPPPVLTPTIAAASVPVPVFVQTPSAQEPAPRKTIRKRRVVAPMQVQAANWQPTETAVQIAIPAEAMFAPGAMPKGMNFIAELSIAPDGSVKQIRLRQ
ncbi:MAG TPA: zf-HC2 domain-containing protein [Candidatus Dormibacteraeota bacterium]|jgi:anti-sigma factor RsiW|nr:zf-HC2 domain-containing protein [Candidatus Dormibacteraeota bacterium]